MEVDFFVAMIPPTITAQEHKIVIRNASTYKETKTAFVDPSFDLCPRCSAEFLDWARMGDRLKKTVEREEAKRAEQEKIDKMLENMPENTKANDLLKKMRGIANSIWGGEKE